MSVMVLGEDVEVADEDFDMVEALRVAPIGVKRELVATVLINGADEPTSIEKGGTKSSICCVLIPVVQLHVGPSAQE